MTTFGERLKNLRQEKDLTTEELGREVGVSASAITNYESGLRYPKKNVLDAITDYFNVDQEYLDGKQEVRNRLNFDGIYQAGYEQGKKDSVPLSSDEQELIDYFRELDKDTQNAIANLVMTLAGRLAQKVEEEIASYSIAPTPSYTILRLYGIGPAAGSGNYLPDDIPQGEIQVLESWASKKADYALRVDGHSMEPRYQDGDIVLVKSQDAIRDGEVGIFAVNGEVVIKQLEGDHLHSLNPDYQDIHLSAGDMVKCLGKVIGKV